MNNQQTEKPDILGNCFLIVGRHYFDFEKNIIIRNKLHMVIWFLLRWAGHGIMR